MWGPSHGTPPWDPIHGTPPKVPLTSYGRIHTALGGVKSALEGTAQEILTEEFHHLRTGAIIITIIIMTITFTISMYSDDVSCQGRTGDPRGSPVHGHHPHNPHLHHPHTPHTHTPHTHFPHRHFPHRWHQHNPHSWHIKAPKSTEGEGK